MFPLLFLHHPGVVFLTKINTAVKAYWEHDGYDYPGAGYWYHHIHHIKYNVNFGSPAFPIDWLFGSYSPGFDVWE